MTGLHSLNAFQLFAAPSFLRAVNRCEPVPRLDHAVADSQLAVKDSVVHYTCVEGFVASDLSAMTTVCDGTKWTSSLAHCEGKVLFLSVS